MKMFDVQIALEGVAEAKAAWSKAVRQFNADTERVMIRLITEAAANYMSVEQVAKFSGYSPKRIRSMMRDNGLVPRKGKRLLAKHAAEALQTNSELLGIMPHQMDLMSPLAYLPMGSEMRQALTDKAVSRVTELPEVSGNWHVEVVGHPSDELYEVYEHDGAEDIFIATFNSREDADTVCALVNKAVSRVTELPFEGVEHTEHTEHVGGCRLCPAPGHFADEQFPETEPTVWEQYGLTEDEWTEFKVWYAAKQAGR